MMMATIVAEGVRQPQNNGLMPPGRAYSWRVQEDRLDTAQVRVSSSEPLVACDGS